ncbi:MAG: pilus assembly protein PilM [Planctomycetota bacterium]|jgi:type IV pilus assembly protein PilM
MRDIMLELFGQSKSRPIGLDIGHSVVKMIQLSQRDQMIRVEAAEEAPLNESSEPGSEEWNQAVAALIRDLYCRGGFKGHDVVSCLPSDMLKIKSLRLDADWDSSIEDTMRTEVARRFGLDAQRDEIRHLVAGDAYQGEEIKSEVIFFGIEQEHLRRPIGLIEQAGLIPVSLDTVPTALFRCFKTSLRRREDQNVVSVFVDLGTQFTTVIIGRGQEIAFIKQIPIAGNELNQQVSKRLGISIEEAVSLRNRLRDAQAEHIDSETKRAVLDAMSGSIENLAHEISLCFRYYAVTFRGQRPDEAAFAGGEAYESALMDALRKHLGVAIRVAEPLRGFDLADANFNRRPNSQMCEWAIAVGLALKGFELDKTKQRCNNQRREVAV